MARTATLAQMRARVRRHADLRTSQFWVDSEVNDQLNHHLAHLYDRLVGAHGERYYEKATPASITTVPGTAGYALPADFYKLSRVSAIVNGREHRLERFADSEIDGTLPVTRALSVSLYYVPACPVLAADGDTFDGINGWEEYPILLTAIDIKQASEEDTTTLFNLLAVQEQRLARIVKPRDKAQAFRVGDVLSRPSRLYSWLPDPALELPRYQLRQSDIELRDGF